MKLDIIPVAKIEKKVISTLKSENIIKFANKYAVQILAEQDPNEKVTTFTRVLNSINYSVVKLPGKPWEIRYSFKKSEGVTKIYLHNDFLTQRPSIIFHHGLGRLNPLHLKVFANKVLMEKFNVFSVRAAHHDSIDNVRKKFLNNFTNMLAAICSSTLAIDEIVDTHKNNSDQKVVVAGVSLGGTVTALHYFYFDSADFYFPIVSYPNFGEILTDRNIKEFVVNYEMLSKNKSIPKSFSIPRRLTNRPKDKIFPILADSDELINFKKASEFWKGYEITNFNVGHNTIFIKGDEIRKLILEKVFN